MAEMDECGQRTADDGLRGVARIVPNQVQRLHRGVELLLEQRAGSAGAGDQQADESRGRTQRCAEEEQQCLELLVVERATVHVPQPGPDHDGGDEGIDGDDNEQDEGERRPVPSDPPGEDATGADRQSRHPPADATHRATAARPRITAAWAPGSSSVTGLSKNVLSSSSACASMPANDGAANDVPLQTAKPDR